MSDLQWFEPAIRRLLVEGSPLAGSCAGQRWN